MRPICLRTVFVRGCVVLLVASGCAGNADKGRSQEPLVTTPPKESGYLPVKKANLPDLPDGAGKMDQDAPDEFTSTASGLYYRILRKGNRHKPRSYDIVLAHYRGWLYNTKGEQVEFESSYHKGTPAEFHVNQVVPGWTEALQLIGEGGMIEIEVPPRLGYGASGRPPTIPPNSTLHFLIELQKIK